MERFLEIILSVEREVASLEKEAKSRLLDLERSYRDGLTSLEEKSLRQVKSELQTKRKAILASAAAEIKEIQERAKHEMELLEKARGRIRKEALQLLAGTLLPPGGGSS